MLTAAVRPRPSGGLVAEVGRTEKKHAMALDTANPSLSLPNGTRICDRAMMSPWANPLIDPIKV